jgi:hypothetical protein
VGESEYTSLLEHRPLHRDVTVARVCVEQSHLSTAFTL